MRSAATHSSTLDELVAALQRGICDEATARRFYQLGPQAVTLALLSAARRIAELQAQAPGLTSPSTPSGMIPVYTKPNANAGPAAAGRRKKPGARQGHPGHRRPRPTRIDQRQDHRLPVCPCCGGPLQRCRRTRTRLIEDLPENLHAQVTEHTLHRDYCPNCKKHVEPVVPDALPNATFGHRLIGLTSWCHYGLGVTIDQLIDILQFHLQLRLSAGGLVAAWQRLGDLLTPWYEQIAEEARKSAYLHADETGWRVRGRTCWLWCFANQHNCYYLIDRNRGSPVLQEFFGEAFDGILLHDFWTAYESIDVADRQYCLVHLLRELEKVDQHNTSVAWRAFARTLRRLLKRLRRTGDHLFTFLDYPQIPFENNFAERQIRPAVILRKNSQSNRSNRGARTQAVLMSVYRTLHLRGHDPLAALAHALRSYLQTGQLPPLPPTAIADA